MNMTIFDIRLLSIGVVLLFITGDVSGQSAEYTINKTLYYNITGYFELHEHFRPRELVDPESEAHIEIAGNLSRGFVKVFDIDTTMFSFSHDVKVIKVFLWPSNGEVDVKTETLNVSFVMLVQNHYNSAPSSDYWASRFIKDHFIATSNISPGQTIFLGGLEINKTAINIHEITEDEVNVTINVINGNMAHLVRVLEDVDESQDNDNVYQLMVTISYVGISTSITGLLVTAMSICYFRRLRKFRGNQILVHICASVMVGMLLSVASYTYPGRRETCAVIAISLHYSILCALCWMCVEAHNLYRDLVKVFNTNILSTKMFFLRACVFAYGLPALLVATVVVVDFEIYGRRNDACWMTPIPFLISFLGPVLLIVSVNLVFFVLIMREIVLVSQRDAHTLKPSLRAAVSLSVLLGFCWIFAGIATFTTHIFFQYAFVMTSSFQGLYIFLFHGIGKKELRDSWKSLSIFNWKFLTSSTESQGRAAGKTESSLDVLAAGGTRKAATDKKARAKARSGGLVNRVLVTTQPDVVREAVREIGWVKRGSYDMLLKGSGKIGLQTTGGEGSPISQGHIVIDKRGSEIRLLKIPNKECKPEVGSKATTAKTATDVSM